MEQKIKRLELETILNQIQSNDNKYDGPFCSFSFDNLNFILINDIYTYLPCIKMEFEIEYLRIIGKEVRLEIKYDKLDTFLINFRETNNVYE